jgi:hypothetical protein
MVPGGSTKDALALVVAKVSRSSFWSRKNFEKH